MGIIYRPGTTLSANMLSKKALVYQPLIRKETEGSETISYPVSKKIVSFGIIEINSNFQDYLDGTIQKIKPSGKIVVRWEEKLYSHQTVLLYKDPDIGNRFFSVVSIEDSQLNHANLILDFTEVADLNIVIS